LSYIDLYFFRKEVTFLPLKVSGASGVLGRGKEYIMAGISRVAIGNARTRVQAKTRVRRLADR
jgi:hypothetical protein